MNDIDRISFKTGDTNVSIWSCSGVPVYLLSPDGVDLNICENNYLGFGFFGGVSVFDWVVDNSNISIDSEFKTVLGKSIIHNDGIFKDTYNNTLYSYKYSSVSSCINHIESIDSIVPGYEMTGAALIKSGIWKELGILSTDILDKNSICFPKLSFDKFAEYKKVGRSIKCPYRGYDKERYTTDMKEREKNMQKIIVFTEYGHVENTIGIAIVTDDTKKNVPVFFEKDNKCIMSICSIEWLEKQNKIDYLSYYGKFDQQSILENIIRKYK